MTAERTIAQVRSIDGYAGLMDAFRARVAEFGTTYEDVGELAGVPLRYVNKLLAPVPIKGIGRHTLGPLLGALGLKLLVVEDTAQMVLLKGRIAPRAFKRADAGDGMPAKRRRKKSIHRGNSAWGQLMRARQILQQSDKQRSMSARKAAKARWRRRPSRPSLDPNPCAP